MQKRKKRNQKSVKVLGNTDNMGFNEKGERIQTDRRSIYFTSILFHFIES